MGAWGHETFQNDCALDWVDDFERKKDKLKFINKTFQTAIAQSEDYLDVDEGSWVLAAAEVLAALKGSPSANLPDQLASWVAQNPSLVTDEQIQQALGAIAIIKNPENSEIAALWEESGKEDWSKAVADLEARLQR